MLAYLANSIRAGGREAPYSLVAALDSGWRLPQADGITLNEWTARDLGAKPGDAVSSITTSGNRTGASHRDRPFPCGKIVPITGAAADRDFAPDYPGITGSESLHDWDPPFPLDLERIRPVDEQYWKHTAPRPRGSSVSRGQQLWQSRFGRLTSIRISPTYPGLRSEELREALDPPEGLAVRRAGPGSAGGQGATDFGEYFVYFSFFLMVSALLLTGLFFKLGVEQRMQEIGVLRALGFSAAKIRGIFLLEGAVLAVAGAAAGIGRRTGLWRADPAGGCARGGSTRWGRRLLALHVSAPRWAWGPRRGDLRDSPPWPGLCGVCSR